MWSNIDTTQNPDLIFKTFIYYLLMCPRVLHLLQVMSAICGHLLVLCPSLQHNWHGFVPFGLTSATISTTAAPSSRASSHAWFGAEEEAEGDSEFCWMAGTAMGCW